MRRFFVGCLALVGGFSILLVAAIIGGAWYFAAHFTPSREELPTAAILSLDLDRGVREAVASDPVSDLLSSPGRTVPELLDALRRGGNDNRIKGLFAELGGSSLGFAQTEELRDAVKAFRAKGKVAVIFAEGFGELGPGTASYYLASAFDEIWVQPGGMVGLTGLRAETPFFKGTLDRLGIEARIERRSAYKSAPDSATAEHQSAADKEQLTALLGAMMRQVTTGVAADRKLTPEQVTALVDRGPLLSDEARDAQLIDHVGYRDEALASVRSRVAGSPKENKPPLVTLSRLLETTTKPDGRKVALIQAIGTIVRGGDDGSPLSGGMLASADALGRAFREAAADKDVAAILFRIDSPGGSASASETIWREIVRAREAGKPVVVSMGNVAASGGYYIAAPADKIVAEPGTITGSIGVFGGKVLLSGLLDKIGAHMESVQVGANAGMWSNFTDYSPAELDRLNRFIDTTYATFKDRVSRGRHMSPEAVERVAQGRVWSGVDAQRLGLVDTLGGYEAADTEIRQLLKLPSGAVLSYSAFSGERDPWWKRAFSHIGLAESVLERLSVLMTAAKPALQATETLEPAAGALRMPAFDVR